MNDHDVILFDETGLVPVVAQDCVTGAVLMVAFMNAEALQKTRETGKVHYWSRSRGRLWLKGESSGHIQEVEDLLVNCDRNSILLKVRQTGAVCHDGYPTCYYRQLNPDDTLTVVEERWFDPSEVYGEARASLEAAARQWYGAYEFLFRTDLAAVSGTSKRLRDPDFAFHERVSDELTELAGVLTGEHVHSGRELDTVLEGSQSLYWLACVAVRAGVPWEQLRVDRALATVTESFSVSTAAKLLRLEAEDWKLSPSTDSAASRVHAAIALVAQACRSVDVVPGHLVEHDLSELRSRDYLASYFA